MTHIKPNGETLRHFLNRISAWTIWDDYEAMLYRSTWRSIIE